MHFYLNNRMVNGLIKLDSYKKITFTSNNNIIYVVKQHFRNDR